MDGALESCKLYAPFPSDVTQIMQRTLSWLHEAEAEAQTLRTYVQVMRDREVAGSFMES